ncbi:cobalamin B12-binding domain-containing protein [Nannocystis pusilla]|uniref:cobalamin B12-binding domain-containing protein n=1 Tax=Nannocystis pusilla TaxID=889268 RepID=UPI003B813ABC
MTLDPTPGDHFASALLAGDRPGALACAREALARGVDHLYEDVVQPALVRLGDLWMRNEITIAEQHVATALAQSVLGALYPEFPGRRPGRGRSSPASRASTTSSARAWSPTC